MRLGGPGIAWVTALPLAWLLAVTLTAGVQKIFHPDPRIGFLAEAAARASGALPTDAATRAIQVFNARLDATMAGMFLVLVATVVVSAAREWIRVWRGQRAVEPDEPPLAGGGGESAFGEVSAVADRMRCC